MLREGQSRFPDDAEICLHLGWVLHRLGDGEALALARRALELRSTDAWVALSTGWLLFDLKSYDLAHDALRLTGVNLTDGHEHLVTSMGRLAAKIASAKGKDALAIDVLRDAVEFDPDDQEVGLELFVLLHNAGRGGEARAQIEAMLSRAPDDEHLIELERETRPPST